jgi:aldose 1-epimerase
MVSPISSRSYGLLPDGQTVEAWALAGRGGLVLEVITLGGIVTRLLAPGRDGTLDDVVLGFNSLDPYLAGHPYFGAIAGRVAGRIAGAAFTLENRCYQLARNDPPNHLHGGVAGFDKRVWKAAPVECVDGAPSLRLTYRSPDGEEGYPGNVDVAVTYTVTDGNAFLIETEAASDRTTPFNLTHHSYFNLSGEGSGTIENHRLTIHSDRFVPVDEDLTPAGRLESTAHNDNDFHESRRLGDAIPLLFQQHGDLYALPDRAANGPRVVARLHDPQSGRALTVSTTERYLQLYTGSSLNGVRAGKSGRPYSRFAGLCLECQGYPDASNVGMRNDILLHPGRTQRHLTAYAFSLDRSLDRSEVDRAEVDRPEVDSQTMSEIGVRNS